MPSTCSGFSNPGSGRESSPGENKRAQLTTGVYTQHRLLDNPSVLFRTKIAATSNSATVHPLLLLGEVLHRSIETIGLIGSNPNAMLAALG